MSRNASPFSYDAPEYVDLEEEEFEAIIGAVEDCLAVDFDLDFRGIKLPAGETQARDERDYHLRYGFLPLYERLKEARENQRLTPQGRVFRVTFS